MPTQKKMPIEERYVYLQVQYERYRLANRRTKGALLAEMVAVTGMHTKSLTRLMNGPPPCRHPRQRQRTRTYGAQVEQLVRLVDEALDHPCRERLQPMLLCLVDHLCALGLAHCDPQTRQQLETISVSTVGRILTRIRQDEPRLRQRSATTSVTQIQAQVPIRNIPWDETTPGHFEVDLVYHSGPSAAGDFVYTLQMVDVATGWSECVAILGRSYRVMRAAFERCLARIPFPVLEVHTDNGAEFLNANLLRYCQQEHITFTRSRAYKKNDQAHVEQKNWTHVRHFAGYDRYEGQAALEALTALYEPLRLYMNFFQPTLKLIGKEQVGGKVRKRYDTARTPYQRVLECPQVSDETKTQLRALYDTLNPVALLRELDRCQDRLWALERVRSTNEATIPSK